MNGLLEVIKVFANGRWSPGLVIGSVILLVIGIWLESFELRMKERFEATQQQMNLRFDAAQQQTNLRFEEVDRRFDAMQQQMDRRFDAMEVRLVRIEDRFALVLVLEDRMKQLHPDLYQGSSWTPAAPRPPYRLGAGPLLASHEAFGACPNPFHPRAGGELVARR